MNIKHFIQGIVIGVANIIPGVSGGTLALALGIYGRLINSIRCLASTRMVKAALAGLTLRPGAWGTLKIELGKADAPFLLIILAGAATAILLCSRLMAHVLENYHPQAYGFFFGLVAVSIIYPYRAIKRRSWRELALFVAAAALMAGMTVMENDAKKIAKAECKAELRVEKETQRAGESRAARLVSFDHPGAARLAVVFLAGALAISAMVLPGISGSFVLLAMGVYFDVLIAINGRQAIFLGVFCLGMAFGLIVITAVVNSLLDKWRDPTMSFMTGLVAGSLVAIWPFKRLAEVAGETIYLGNTLPASFGAGEWATVLWTTIGAAAVAGCLLVEKGMPGKNA